MGKFSIKKLIVVSDTEQASRELTFVNGLNILAGKNTTGKSSLLKSIFFTFGCEVIFDKDWKSLKKRILVYFSYGKENYIIERVNKVFYIYKCSEQFEVINGNIYSFTELSNFFMSLLEINMSWVDKNGKSVPISMPHLLSFSYIDQDAGWGDVARSFKRLDYVLKWRDKLIKYIINYQTNEYFKIKEHIELTSISINEKNRDYNTNKVFHNSIMEDFKDEYDFNIVDNNDIFLSEITRIERKIIQRKKLNSSLRNNLYEKELLLRALKRHSNELSQDHHFAGSLDENITCPYCGVEHENDIFAKSELIKDIQRSNDLMAVVKEEISELEEHVKIGKEKLKNLEKALSSKKNSFEVNKEKANIIEAYKSQGRIDILNKSEEQLALIEDQIGRLLFKKTKLEEDLKKIESPKRRNGIRNELLSEIANICEEVNLKIGDFTLRNFIPILNRTGSKRARMLYVYYISLYLHNLESKSLSLLVIDTPNQQGQDELNLKGIYNLLSKLTDTRGQVIIGTEKTSDYDLRDINLTILTEKENCLQKEGYKHHKSILNQIDNIMKINDEN